MTVGQIALTVSDLDRAKTFYRDVVGLTQPFDVPNMAFFDCGGIRLMLALPDGGETFGRGSAIYFKVENIQQTAATMKERGALFDREPHLVARMKDYELWMAFFRDPDRNQLALMSAQPLG